MVEEIQITKEDVKIVVKEVVDGIMDQRLGVIIEQQEHNFKLYLEAIDQMFDNKYKETFGDIAEHLENKVSREEYHKNMAKLQFNKI